MRSLRVLVFGLIGVCVLVQSIARGEVAKSSATGFQVVHSVNVDLPAKEAYRVFIEDFSKWYDASHSYTMKAENLSLDIEQACMLEKMPDGGYLRHLEIVFHQPGKMIRMIGGLGPLQGMGVAGALTFTFAENEGKTKVAMTYMVSGADFLQLEQIAAPVDQVLTAHVDRFEEHCRSTKRSSTKKAAAQGKS